MLHGQCMNWCCAGIAWIDAARALHELMLREHCMNCCCAGIAWIDAARALHELLHGHCINCCCTGIAWFVAQALWIVARALHELLLHGHWMNCASDCGLSLVLWHVYMFVCWVQSIVCKSPYWRAYRQICRGISYRTLSSFHTCVHFLVLLFGEFGVQCVL